MLRLLLFLAVSINAPGANAQTVEEEVALIVYGFEPGRAIGSACGLIQIPEVTSGSPAKYRFDCGNGDWSETVFRQIDGCIFETFLTMNGGEPDRRDVLDFSKFRGLMPARGDAATMGHFFEASPDFCTSSDGKSCMFDFLSIATGECCVLAGVVPRERVESALSLISNYCRP
jgi:hypothetical protein